MANLPIKLLLSFMLLTHLPSCSDSTTAKEYLAQAKQSLANNEENTAIIALKNAARLEPDNADVRFYLGSAYIEQGDYFSAEKEFDRVLKAGGEQALLYAKLAEVKVKLRKYDEAFALVDSAKHRPSDEFIAVLTYAGIGALYQEKPELAKDYIDQAIGISGESAYGSLGKVYLSFAEQNFAQGIKVVDQLLATDPSFLEALLLKAYLLQGSQQHKQAGDTFLDYAKQRPKEIRIHYLVAQNYLSASEFELAQPRVEFLLKLMKNEPYANQMKAQLEFQKQDYEIAKKHAEIAVQQNEDLKVSRVIAGYSAYKLDDYEQAYQHLIKVKGDVPADHVVNKLLIDLQLRLGYDDEALTALRGITNVNEMDSSLLTNASYQLLQSGRVEEAKELLKTSISLNTQNPAELAKQGVIQFQLQQSEQGINLLEKALAIDPEHELAENMLAATYLQAEKYQDALKMAKAWQADEQKAARGYLLESSILLQRKDVDGAKGLLEKVLTVEPNNIPALFKLALFEHKAKQADKAFSYYVKVLNLRPNHVGAVKNLVVLVRDNPSLSERAITFYNGMLAMSPDHEFALFGLAYIYKANKTYDQAVATFKKLLDTSKNITGIELALGDIYKLQGKWDKAIDTYKSYLTRNPRNLAAAHKIFSAFEQLGQISNSLEYVDKTRSYYPNNKGLLLLKVYYQSVIKELVSVADIDLLRKSTVIKDHWLFAKTLGNIAYNQKDFVKAGEHYQVAYLKEPNEQNAMNWAKTEGLKNNYSGAIDILNQFINNHQATANSKLMLADAYTKANQPKKADSIFTAILNDNANNVVALNNLALVKLSQQANQAALNYAERAIKLASNNAVILDTYGQALAANNSFDKAIIVYDQALARVDSATKAEIMLHKGQVLKQTNKSALLADLVAELNADKSLQLTAEQQQLLTELTK